MGHLKIHHLKVPSLMPKKMNKFYVLGPDLKARGLDKSSLISNIDIIDYKDFVKLTVENDKIQNWL